MEALLAAIRFDQAALAAVLEKTPSAIAQGWRLDRGAEGSLRAAEQQALRDRSPDTVVHAAALRALHLSRDRSRVEEAVDVARRASRMARVEAQPEMEYLAHLVLARIRRLSGRPYLATRILGALLRYTPPAWHPWIGWELGMAGGLSTTETCTVGPASILRRALLCASDGDRAGWDACVKALRDESWPLIVSDVAGVAAAVDAGTSTEDDDFERWRCGDIDTPPDGLLGIAGGAGIGSVAGVVVNPGHAPRRILRLGAKLAGSEVELVPTRRRGARVDTLLAVLALCPEGADLPELFRTCWGFKFVETIHKETLEVTLHRARERLGEHARIERSGGALRLVTDKRMLVPDPRCSPDADERVLQHVARAGSVNARDAARALHMSLRAVQDALKQLVDGGACERRRDGRTIVYAVEDTTFREPTVM